MRTRTPLALAAAAALLLAACETEGNDTDLDLGTTEDDAAEDTDEQPDDAQEDAAEDGEVADAPADDLDGGEVTTTGLAVASSDLGDHVVDADGRTVYVSVTRGDDDACVGDCAQVWPPVLVDGEPELGEGIDESLVDTVELDDGTTQLTYDGQRLHYYFSDEDAGDVQSQGLVDEWFVVAPTGEAIGAPEGAGEDAATEDTDEADEDDGEDG